MPLFLRQRTFLLMVIFASLFGILVDSSLATNSEVEENSQNEVKQSPHNEIKNVCTSFTCVSQSAGMMASMDLSVRPCDDFYQYACGNWNRTNPFSNVYSRWNGFLRHQLGNYLFIEKLLEQPSELLKSKAEKNAQRYYQSCLQMTRKAKEDMGPSGEMLQKTLDLMGGWPGVRKISNDIDWTPSQWNFQEAFETAHNILNTDGGLFSWQVDVEEFSNLDTRPYIIKVNHGGLTLGDINYYLDETNYGLPFLIPTFNTMVSEAMENFSFHNDSCTNLGKNKFLRSVNDIIEVETRIAQIIPLVRSNGEYLTIAHLNVLAPFMDWLQFFQSAFSQVDVALTSSQILLVSSPTYLRNLSVLVNDLLSTESGKTKLRNYLIWRVTYYYFQLVKKCWGIQSKENLLHSCATDTNNAMGPVVGSMFIRKMFDAKSSKRLAEKMTHSIKQSFKERLKNVCWLDNETRLQILDKVDSAVGLIGYPDFLLNSTVLDDYYGDLQLESDEYFLNNVRLNNLFLAHKKRMVIDRAYDRNDWDGSFTVSSTASYNQRMNQIVLPIGSLQQPLFDVAYPPALNFGSIGFFIAHELTHGFDTNGRLYDRYGNLRQWWNNDTIQRFEQRAECFKKQYSNFVFNGHPIDGELTLAENIADNGGLKIALNAFRSYVKSHHHEFLTLPGLNLSTQDQLFFLSFAQLMCSSATLEDRNFFETYYTAHSPDRYRVLGTLANMPEFASAYSCQPGSPMNPQDKCEIW